MKKLMIFLVIFHFFLGIGAMAGGLGGILNPENPMGMPADALKYGPFRTFLIPGLFLFIVIGLGNVVAGILVFRNVKYQAYITGVLSAILCFWIAIQCLILWDIALLHWIFFFYGVIGVLIAVYLAFKQKLYPTQLILKFVNKG